MRIVQSTNEFVDSFLGAQREAAASFGINTILLEKYITKPRHIEVQVWAIGCNNLSAFFPSSYIYKIMSQFFAYMFLNSYISISNYVTYLSM